MVACAGLAGATAMVITSNSSTSWLALGGSLVGLAFWPLRKQMRLIRWGLVADSGGAAPGDEGSGLVPDRPR